MNHCINCDVELTYEEIGIYKKLINRASKEYMCKNCLAEELNVSTEMIDRKIKQFKEQGCILFSK